MSLWNKIEYWDSKKYRWENAFRKDLAYVPKSSLAESSQAGMIAAGDKAISLVDALIADFGDSAKLDAKWENHKRGDNSRRGEVVKGFEHISTIVLVNIWVARFRVPLVLSVGIWICKNSTINT